MIRFWVRVDWHHHYLARKGTSPQPPLILDIQAPNASAAYLKAEEIAEKRAEEHRLLIENITMLGGHYEH